MKKRLRCCCGCCALSLCALVCAAIGLRLWRIAHKPDTTIRRILHSHSWWNEVHIPFWEDDSGEIYVQANIAGRHITCNVDTGGDSISWPLSLHLPGKHTGSTREHAAGGLVRPAEDVIVPDIRLGAYELQNILTDAVQNSAGSQAFEDVVPILGNDAFDGLVLTIDYRQHLLILRSRDYDLTKQPRRMGDQLLDFTWTKSQ